MNERQSLQRVKRPQQRSKFFRGIPLKAYRIIVPFAFWPNSHARIRTRIGGQREHRVECGLVLGQRGSVHLRQFPLSGQRPVAPMGGLEGRTLNKMFSTNKTVFPSEM